MLTLMRHLRERQRAPSPATALDQVASLVAEAKASGAIAPDDVLSVDAAHRKLGEMPRPLLSAFAAMWVDFLCVEPGVVEIREAKRPQDGTG
jgi:hypothetical protein